MASKSVLLTPVRKLRATDFCNNEHVTVYTPLCTNFELQKLGKMYKAFNRTEWMAGSKTYGSLAALKKDLQPR